MQLRINVIHFWASIAPMISMIKWQCHSCYFVIVIVAIIIFIIIIIIIFMMCHFNEYAGFTWFSCHAGFARLLLDSCYGRWFVYVKQRNATASCWHCVQAARALCWERVSLTWILIGNQSNQGNIPDAVTWACAVRTCIQRRHVLCC